MKQSKIPVPRQELPDPEDYTCEWCGEQAKVRHEMKKGGKRMPTQRYVFSCFDHRETARKALEKGVR